MSVKAAILDALAELEPLPPAELLGRRLRKFLAMGVWEEAGEGG